MQVCEIVESSLQFAGPEGRVGIKNKERILRAASYVNHKQPNHQQSRAQLYAPAAGTADGLKPVLELSTEDTKLMSQFLQTFFKNPKLSPSHRWLYNFLSSPSRIQQLANELRSNPQYATVISNLNEPKHINAFLSAMNQIT